MFRRTSRASEPVHPRASGERASPQAPKKSGYGSSPRERGTRIASDLPASHRRFIPARAGNANGPAWPRRRSTVHPRASGERLSDAPLLLSASGSSPRERGTPGGLGANALVLRFIPARAGNATRVPRAYRIATVHPRASGERKSTPRVVPTMPGSSPRERGTPPDPVADRPHGRFIPARAGNAPSPSKAPAPPPVHPRASRERAEGLLPDVSIGGSSPRERGTPAVEPVFPELHRFIPARAGNAGTATPAVPPPAVHPRASGEHEESR